MCVCVHSRGAIMCNYRTPSGTLSSTSPRRRRRRRVDDSAADTRVFACYRRCCVCRRMCVPQQSRGALKNGRLLHVLWPHRHTKLGRRRQRQRPNGLFGAFCGVRRRSPPPLSSCGRVASVADVLCAYNLKLYLLGRRRRRCRSGPPPHMPQSL